MKTHHIKCHSEFFKPIIFGLKPFELREDDRDYQVNDFLDIDEYDPLEKEFTGRSTLQIITTKIKDTRWLQPGVCCLGIRESCSSLTRSFK